MIRKALANEVDDRPERLQGWFGTLDQFAGDWPVEAAAGARVQLVRDQHRLQAGCPGDAEYGVTAQGASWVAAGYPLRLLSPLD